MKQQQNHHVAQEAVLSKAVQRMAEAWGIANKDLAEMMGVSPSFISRLKQGKAQLHPDQIEGKLALLLIRVFRSLGAFLGDRMHVHQAWLRAENQAFNASPLERMKSPDGLAQVVYYLDAMRGAEG